MAKPVTEPSKRPRRFQTTRGLRRLSYAEAYFRRGSDSSRQRVMELYGRTKPPTAPRPSGPTSSAPVANGEDTRRITDPKPGTPNRPKPAAPRPNILSPSYMKPSTPRRTRRRRRKASTGGAVAPY